MRHPSVRRLLAMLVVACLALLVLAPAAFATALSGGLDGGQGAYGEANDKVVTNVGFIAIAFFPLLALLLSLLQWRLEKRKDLRLAAKRRRANAPEWRGGW
jgi:preprotein translocase subunit SecG